MADKPTALREKLPALAAAAGASVCAAWVSSFAGIAGTLAGVAGGSLISGVAASLFERAIDKSHEAAKKRKEAWLRNRHPGPPADSDATMVIQAVRARDIPWKRAAVLGFCFLVVSLGSVLGAEAVAHKPVAAIVTGQPGHGCSLCGGVVDPVTPSPAPVVSPSPSPSATAVPSISPSPSPFAATVSPSPSPSPSPSSSPSPSPSPSPAPTINVP